MTHAVIVKVMFSKKATADNLERPRPALELTEKMLTVYDPPASTGRKRSNEH